MVLVLFTALMALYAAYSANIVVLLQAPSDSIRTLAQLAHSKITVAAYDVDYSNFVFRVSMLTKFYINSSAFLNRFRNERNGD